MPTNHDKRIFAMAEELAAIANEHSGSLHQPEDFMQWLRCNITMTAEESEEEADRVDKHLEEMDRAGHGRRAVRLA